jgi:transcriptional regulator with XRE-family HTH domain
MDSIGGRLRAERRLLRLSQTDLAALTGTSKMSQARYEGDKRSPDATYLAAVSKVGVDVLYVLTGRRERPEDGGAA